MNFLQNCLSSLATAFDILFTIYRPDNFELGESTREFHTETKTTIVTITYLDPDEDEEDEADEEDEENRVISFSA